MSPTRASGCLIILTLAASACGSRPAHVLTFSGSVVGREGDVIRRQLDRFREENPSIAVALRVTPDAADQRHQLYVQWLNARSSEPDVLQLDVAWTAEFAAAGWISRLDRFQPPVDAFFASTVAADRWNGLLYALPWFIDAGMLYWRTDLAPHPPPDIDALVRLAKQAQRERRIPFGLVFQGARYEGLVTVFVEFLGAFGGSILDGRGRVVVDSDAAQKALTFMRDAIYVDDIVPPAVLTWQEEQTRFAFQNGDAVFMRNWPYAYALLEDPAQSSVAGKFAVTSMPAAPGGTPTAALGGAALAINAYSDQPDDAYRLLEFLLKPDQMVERARIVGQYPSRRSLYESGALDDALGVPPAEALRIINRAVPRPVTPVYTQLSEILQVSLHRALTRQQEPQAALVEAATAMRALLTRVQLSPVCHEEHGAC
jgi:ABC-type glycerol-3-phosphate transport system substrate-binding protein